jgi:hypothetical protein
MGINMLEGSEMGALTESRLGNKCFVDEDNYNNFLGLTIGGLGLVTNKLGITNFSVLTKKQKEQRAKFERDKVENTWKIDPTKVGDCDYLTTRLQQLQNTIASESEVYIKDKVAQQRILVPLKRMEVQYLNAISQAKCEEKRTKAEAEATKKETLDLLTTATATPPSSSASDEKSSKTTKYIMYGVGGLILVLGVLVVLKKR